MTTTAEVLYDSAPPTVRWLVIVQPGDERDMFVLADQGVVAWDGFVRRLGRAREPADD